MPPCPSPACDHDININVAPIPSPLGAPPIRVRIGSRVVCPACATVGVIERSGQLRWETTEQLLLAADIQAARIEVAERVGDRDWLNPRGALFDPFNPYWLELSADQQQTIRDDSAVKPIEIVTEGDTAFTVGRDEIDLLVVGAGAGAHHILETINQQWPGFPFPNCDGVFEVEAMNNTTICFAPADGHHIQPTLQIVFADRDGMFPWDHETPTTLVLAGPDWRPTPGAPVSVPAYRVTQ